VTARLAPLLVALALTLGCDDEKTAAGATARTSATTATSAPSSRPPALELLYLPDGGDTVLGGDRAPSIVPRTGFCPGDMVNVASRYCIDRYEATLVDAKLGRGISPYFPARRADAVAAFEAFRNDSLPIVADAPALPIPPEWELEESFDVRATSRSLAVPNGYLSGVVAGEACRAAGKRLCTLEEWTIACRGEKNRRFPYGDDYEDGACNVSREAHPASVLHGNASIHHLDPRLNLVRGPLGPLLRRTGESPRCRSEWSGDAVFDMVGNLDEWVDDAEGTFAGGFYSRATKDGCEARIESHPMEYFDYSLGVRCCR
jgi:hypothetical protein